MKALLFIFGFLSLNYATADIYYTNYDASIPAVGIEASAYMGDKMLEQKIAYNEKCLTAKKYVRLEAILDDKNSTECLTANKRFEKKCCFDGIRQIEEGGTMCKVWGAPNYIPVDFYSFEREDGSEKSRDSNFMIREKKGKFTILQMPAKAKVVKLTEDEFNDSFTINTYFWEASVVLNKGMQMCMSKPYESENFPIAAYDHSPGKVIKNVNGDVQKGYFKSVVVMPSENNNVSILLRTNEGERKGAQLSDLEFNETFEETSRTVETSSKMQRTIEYAGIQGDMVKFIYAEYMDNMARDAFTREFTIDLSVDNVAAYKGAVFEVIKATNSMIKYKVIRNFPSGT